MTVPALLEENHHLKAKLAEHAALVAELTLRNQVLAAEKADLLRRMFGAKSERMDPRQYHLALASALADHALAAAEPPEVKAPSAPAKRRGGGRRPVPANLPVERIVLDLPEEKKAGLVQIREEITQEIDYRPSQFIRREYVRPVYADPSGRQAPIVAELPARTIPQASVGPGLLAHLVVAKYVDHLPLYRQEQMAARVGIDLPRQKLCRWTEGAALLLKTIHDQLRERIVGGRYLQADETPVKVLDPDRPGAARASWLWTYHGPEVQALVFDFHLSRGRDSPREFIPEDWKGILQTDGYELYRALCAERPGIVHAGCMAHARRKWVEAMDAGGETVAGILADLARLYQIEAEARAQKLTPAARALLRQSRAVILLDTLRQKLERARDEALPQSRIGVAAHYALARWPALTRYAQPDCGHVEIDNNPTENCIRPTALGKKNWLFIGHPEAGWKSAVLYSVLGTCKLLKVNPEDYLTWVLPKLAAATNHSAASGLLPHDYAALVKEPGA